MALAALPATVAVYQFTRQGDNAYFTRLIRDTYDDYKNKWAQRNDLHTQAMEQAAADKLLFLNEGQKGPRFVDIRFPEYVYPSFDLGCLYCVCRRSSRKESLVGKTGGAC